MEQFRVDTGKIYRVKRVTGRAIINQKDTEEYNKIVDMFCAITDIETEYNGAEKSIREAGFI